MAAPAASTSKASPFVDLGLRVIGALDPRAGNGWGRFSALRAPALVILAAAADVAVYGYHVEIPTALLDSLNGIALAVLGHDAGVLKPTPQAQG